MKQNFRSGLVKGRLPAQKIYKIKLNHATFEGSFFLMFSWAKQMKK
jgi:hypothetical protein